ncbi:MAG: ribonuclease R [Phycisphaeraceae bacterium]|nr:ribonuclease R [Phycisphaeraceae bacterium]
MQEALKKHIIKHLQEETYIPVKLAQIARDLGIGDEDYPAFETAFDQLRNAGHIVIGQKNRIDLRPLPSQIIGIFRANARGFGFVAPSEPYAHGDLFIPPSQINEAMSGDRVVAKVVSQRRGPGETRYSGEIVDILERSQNRFVGTLTRQHTDWLVQPDEGGFFDPIQVPDAEAKNARHNDKVVVEILSYPTARHLASGVIIEVLGKSGKYETEILATIRRYHFAQAFDQDCQDQAHSMATAFKGELEPHREDITEKLVITIDPPTAKDFDDAISLERNDQGHTVLGVHIADVSHFIAAESPLDLEARTRGNSIYLPGKTLPMLPEILSNGVCSLQPNENRYTKSAYITYDQDANIVNRRFANSLIRSSHRLTYDQAHDLIQGRTGDLPQASIEQLKAMDALSRAIEKRRHSQGMLHLDLQETELVFSEAGEVVDTQPVNNCYTHTMIEMFMVEANEAVAALLDRKNIPILRRIHPDPDPVRLKNLSRLLENLGFNVPKQLNRSDIQALLDQVQGTERSLGVNLGVLRSLAKAEYSPAPMGHYALASACYSHFTSPIRRYADLLIHRCLQFYLEDRVAQAKQYSSSLDLTSLGRQISLSDQNAENAERELHSLLVLHILKDHVGEEFQGVITGLTGFGVFVQLSRFGAEGLIKLQDLGSDKWQFNARMQCIVGKGSGKILHLGRAIQVRIASVNLTGRHLDLLPSKPVAKASPKTNKKKKNTKLKMKQKAKKRPAKRKRK